HDGVDESAQQHERGEHDVHDADALVVDRGDPLVPQIGPVTLDGDPSEHRYRGEKHDEGRAERDRFMEWNCGPVELSEHRQCVPSPCWSPCPAVSGSARSGLTCGSPAAVASGPGAGGRVCRTIASNRPGWTCPNTLTGSSMLCRASS